MIDHLIQHLCQYADLTQEEKEYLKVHIPVQTFKKGDYLLKQGKLSQAFYYIITGCVRLFYEVGEEERTAFFYTETQFVSSYEK